MYIAREPSGPHPGMLMKDNTGINCPTQAIRADNVLGALPITYGLAQTDPKSFQDRWQDLTGHVAKDMCVAAQQADSWKKTCVF